MSATPSPVVRKRWQDAMTKELEEEAAYYEKLSSPEKKKYLAELQAATDKFEASRAKKKSLLCKLVRAEFQKQILILFPISCMRHEQM